MKKPTIDLTQTFTAAEVYKTVRYMMTNELMRQNGNSCDEKYINGFMVRLVNNIKEDRERKQSKY